MHPARSDLQRSYSVLWRQCLKTLRSYYSFNSQTIFLLSFFPDTSTKLCLSLKEYLRKKLMYKNNGIKWKLETLLCYNLTKMNSLNPLRRFNRLLMNHVILIISRVRSNRNNYFIAFSRKVYEKKQLGIHQAIHHVSIKSSAPSNTFLSFRLKLVSTLQNVDWSYPHFIRNYVVSLASYQFRRSIYPSAKFSRSTDTISLGIWIWS